MKMPFGKYRGVEITQLDGSYLRWLHNTISLREPLRSAVADEYAARFPSVLAPQVRCMANDIVNAGFRKLAREHHPDHGGTTSAMQLLNCAVAYLRATVGGVR